MSDPNAPRRTAMFPTTEGDLWRWQLETLEALTKFIRRHGPGLPGALPAVPWQVSNGFHAVARLCEFDGPPDFPRDRREVLAAYAAALGSEVTSVDLGRGDTEYRVKGAIGERGRVTLTLTATVRAEDDPACPCGCTSTFCRCCDPETCTCGPACPVCDADGGE
jgi:hypothetical protein